MQGPARSLPLLRAGPARARATHGRRPRSLRARAAAYGKHTLHTFQQKAAGKLNRDRKKGGHYKGEPLVITDESPVIMNISGRRLNPTALSKWWENDRKIFGLDGVTFHELRHTYLTMLALNGVHPRVVNLDAKHQAADILDHALTA